MIMPSELAATITALLAPFAPYLVEGGKKFAAKSGEAAWTAATHIWEKIMVGTEHDKKIRGHALVLAAEPSDPVAKKSFESALLQQLIQRPELADALSKLLQADHGSQEVTASGKGSITRTSQDMKGAGTQSIRASEEANIEGVRQTKR
jgi:uncharacterized protein (DUF1501 family)